MLDDLVASGLFGFRLPVCLLGDDRMEIGSGDEGESSPGAMNDITFEERTQP